MELKALISQVFNQNGVLIRAVITEVDFISSSCIKFLINRGLIKNLCHIPPPGAQVTSHLGGHVTGTDITHEQTTFENCPKWGEMAGKGYMLQRWRWDDNNGSASGF